MKRLPGAAGFYFTKNEHPKGFGALEDCPIKQLRSSLLPQALPLTDRRERA